MDSKILEFIEFEVKYPTTVDKLYEFKFILEKLTPKSFIYIESDDVYYIKGDDFLRYRSASESKNKKAELTFKNKTTKDNNIKRVEVNLRVDGNNREVIDKFTSGLGYSYNFTISKYNHIYIFDDAVLAFYTVKDSKGDVQHFIEIEVNENNSFTEEQGWSIIKKWEEVLSPLGIKAQNRLKKSLFERYRSDNV